MYRNPPHRRHFSRQPSHRQECPLTTPQDTLALNQPGDLRGSLPRSLPRSQRMSQRQILRVHRRESQRGTLQGILHGDLLVSPLACQHELLLTSLPMSRRSNLHRFQPHAQRHVLLASTTRTGGQIKVSNFAVRKSCSVRTALLGFTKPISPYLLDACLAPPLPEGHTTARMVNGF